MMLINKGAAVLITAKLCNSFAHFGIRAIFVLYLISGMGFVGSRAFGVNAVLFSIMELGSIVGGYLGDKCLGLKNTLFLGSVFLTAGFFLLLDKDLIYIALGVIVVGGSLFGSNIPALLGLQYEKEDKDRKKAFTYLYMAQNFGGLLGVIVCSALFSYVGEDTAFLTIFLMMAVASTALLLGRKSLKTFDQTFSFNEKMKALVICSSLFFFVILLFVYEDITLLIFPYLALLIFGVCCRSISKTIPVGRFFLYLAAVVVFFAASDQMFSSLLVFTKEEVNPMLFGVKIPPSFIVVINPITIVLLGSFFAKRSVSLLIPFLAAAICFAGVSLADAFFVKTPILVVLGVVGVISLGELFLGPRVFDYASGIGNKEQTGIIMALVSVSFAIAYQFSGILSKMVASQKVVANGFGWISFIMLFAGFIFFVIERLAARKANVS